MKRWPDALRGLHTHSPFDFALDTRRCLALDLGARNAALVDFDPARPQAARAWIEQSIAAAGADYAAGGYGEDRALYRSSPAFNTDDEPRTVHLGMDLWVPAGAAVHAVLPGTVLSVRDNAGAGDYGPTVILEHALEGLHFYTLYGHLARRTLQVTRTGMKLEGGALLGWLGETAENGGWPPHLHFQIIADLEGRVGDYPGVCKRSEAAAWLARCPDPNLLLRIAALS